MDKILEKLEKKPLSDGEILEGCNNKCNIVCYSDMHKYHSIDELLNPYDCCIILYNKTSNCGHWCALIKRNNLLEFFDPYGLYPDEELKYIKKYEPYLSYLMIDSPYKLSYNQYKFQKFKKDINTCGRWCYLRIQFKDWSLDKFNKYFTKKDNDKFATFLTYDL
jgi:hypothetical protein